MLDSVGNFLESTLGSFPILLSVQVIAFSIKLIFFIVLIRNISSTITARKPSLFILLVLLGGMFGDCSWILKLTHNLFFSESSYQPVLFLTRISWAMAVVQYQSLALFIESLVQKPFKISLRHKIFLIMSGGFILFFLGLAFFHFHRFELFQRASFEYAILRLAPLYMIFPLMLSSLFYTIRKLHSQKTPRILHRQLIIFIKAVITPYLIVDFIQVCPSNLSSSWLSYWITNSYAVITVSTILLTYAIFYCARKMMGLRFLNMRKHVKSHTHFSFIENFTDVFEQLNNALSLKELIHITQALFKDAFVLPARSISLHLRPFDAKSAQECIDYEQAAIEEKVETIIDADNTELSAYLKRSKILIYDELEFNNFYEENQKTTVVLNLLDSINADIFLPIYKHKKIIAYATQKSGYNNHQRKRDA